MSDPNTIEPGTIIYNKSPNVQVADDEGNLHRANLVAVAPGEIRFNDPDNSPNVEVADEDGVFHRAQLVAMIGGGGGGSVDKNHVIVKSDTIPAAGADTYNQFYCFDGATNSSYTHGYIYQCIADESTNYIIALTPSQDYSINKLAFDYEFHSPIEIFERIASLSTPVFDPTEVKTGSFRLDKVNEIWYVSGYDADNNLLFEDFTISATGDQTSLDAYGFVYIDHFPDNFEDGYTEDYQLLTQTSYSNYRWERMDVQPAAKLGRYLSGWNCATGLAVTNPQESQYEYTTGDYFIVSTVASDGASNYRPNGSSYVIGQASSTVESSIVSVNDTYLYDGTNWTLLKTGSTVTSVNGQTGAVTVQETLVNQSNIKSINGNSLLGSGNLELTQHLTFPNTWPTTSSTTTKAFCDAVAADTTAVAGKMYLGEVRWSDLPGDMANAECIVEIMDGTTAANKVIVLTVTSGNVAPYRWQYTYWNNGSSVSGWVGFTQTTVTFRTWGANE